MTTATAKKESLESVDKRHRDAIDRPSDTGAILRRLMGYMTSGEVCR